MLKTQSNAHKRERMEQSDNQGAGDQPQGYTVIENCPMAFECPKTWDALTPTENASIRHCDECDEDIIFCDDQSHLAILIKSGQCVAYFVEQNREVVKVISRPAGSSDSGAFMDWLENDYEPTTRAPNFEPTKIARAESMLTVSTRADSSASTSDSTLLFLAGVGLTSVVYFIAGNIAAIVSGFALGAYALHRSMQKERTALVHELSKEADLGVWMAMTMTPFGAIHVFHTACRAAGREPEGDWSKIRVESSGKEIDRTGLTSTQSEAIDKQCKEWAEQRFALIKKYGY
jgi:hypothetical protein